MDKKVEKLLTKLNKIAKEYDESIYNDIEPSKIDEFSSWYSLLFKDFSNANNYLDVVSKIDGFEFDGLSFYSLDNSKDNNIYESNEIYWENEDMKEYLFLGEDSISWFVYSPRSNKFLVLDNPSGSLIEEFDNSDELFIYAFKSII